MSYGRGEGEEAVLIAKIEMGYFREQEKVETINGKMVKYKE